MAAPQEFLQALQRRANLRAPGTTDAFRLLDGRGDGAEFDALFIDDFAGHWLVQTARPGQTLPEWLRTIPAPHTPRSIYWKRLDARDQRPPEHWWGEPVPGPFVILENGLRFQIDFAAGYSQGIFLDQRDNRLALRQRLTSGQTLLNCFAYTCAFSVVAAAAGAETVSVDLSHRALDWGRENFRLNELDPSENGGHEFLAGDVVDWLGRFSRRGRHFDAIVLDPPTFSRNRDGKVFRLERDFGALAAGAAELLAPGGTLLCSTNARSVTAAGFRHLLVDALPGGPRVWQARSTPMPADFTGEPYLQTEWFERAR